MGKVISVFNQKGGVGKSTTAVNVGAYLALSGKKVLLIDLDPQGNASTSCGIARGKLSKTIAEVMSESAQPEEAIVDQQIVQGMYLLPSGHALSWAEQQLSQQQDSEYILKRICEKIRSEFDAILIDCPPSLGILTANALTAADYVLVPVQCEYLALEGLNALLQAIQAVKGGPNPHLAIGGIVLTMADVRANLTKEVTEEIRRFFQGLVFDSQIPRNVRLAECPSFGKPICVYDPNSAGAVAYERLTKEILGKLLETPDPETTASPPATAAA